MNASVHGLLAKEAPELERIVRRSMIHTPPQFSVSQIRYDTVNVAMRDGVRLATDLYLPPLPRGPVVAVRTPYGRGIDSYAGIFLSFARRGYILVSQDCRGTGESEPDTWDYYMYEQEDGFDLVEWITQQSWFDGFLGACGGSYVGQTQWHMAMHPSMSTIVPDVSGLGIAVNTVHLHMFATAYARSVGKGSDKVATPFFELEAQMLTQTLATGYFNDPLPTPIPDPLVKRFPSLHGLALPQARSWLWEHYCSLTCAERAEFVRHAMGVENVGLLEVESLSAIFGCHVSHDAHTLPHPNMAELCKTLHAPVLLRTGWYDWGLNDTLATWDLLMQATPEQMRCRCRLFIAPSAHNTLGYHESIATHPELHHAYSASTTLEMLLRWYKAIREDRLESWPVVIYYLMGANEWRASSTWPPPDALPKLLYLNANGTLTTESPPPSRPDRYTYDPNDPTPTVGGSIVSYVYPPGSVDVAAVQQRSDVLTYTTKPLAQDLDVIGPLKLVLYASSSAIDTDFAARVSDVFPDGRAIQLQSGILRARYRNRTSEPEPLEPNRVYRFEIDIWATANRFKEGHRLRVDISSADFPRFDRNNNRGGVNGEPIRARQTVYHDPENPSHLLVSVVGNQLAGELAR